MSHSRILLYALAGPLAFHGRAPAQSPTGPVQEPVITVDGVPFETWGDYLSSSLFQARGLRCAFPDSRDVAPGFNFVPSDCGFTHTNPAAEYAPTFTYDIPVVVHVIMSTGGQGNITDAKVQSQIDILNEDFLALTGTNGSMGTNAQIQFHLATEDPAGNPTNGITRSTNNTWFNDGGSYWNTLAWDPHRYLNIYTNQASGALGYVPGLPQSGLVGQANDRVVCLWSAFGRNAPIGPPYNQGRTATHEVGHYLGLWHTFSGGCVSTSNCYDNGDFICDTNPESSPTFGCPGSRVTCGLPAPFDNYMDYSDDLCMELFTGEQTLRMRCTLQHWRPNLATVVNNVTAVASIRNGTGVNPSNYFPVNTPRIGMNWEALVFGPPPYISVIIPTLNGPTSGTILSSGELLVQPPFLPYFVSTGSHSIPIPSEVGLLGRQYSTQGATLVSGALTLLNAVDLTFGNQ